MSSGKGRSWFSPQLRKKLQDYIDAKSQKDIRFQAEDFQNVKIQAIAPPEKSFIYADPPYAISDGTYNQRDKLCEWSAEHEENLFHYLDALTEAGYPWACSNVIQHQGKTNENLRHWSEKYTTYHLDMSYKNCNYHRKNFPDNQTDEVLITNEERI